MGTVGSEVHQLLTLFALRKSLSKNIFPSFYLNLLAASPITAKQTCVYLLLTQAAKYHKAYNSE